MLADVERPSFGGTCPSDIKRYADRTKNYTTVTWTQVVATDNSGVVPNVTEYGVPTANRFYEGRHRVTYNASDSAGNHKVCTFIVTIEGKPFTIGTLLTNLSIKYKMQFNTVSIQIAKNLTVV